MLTPEQRRDMDNFPDSEDSNGPYNAVIRSNMRKWPEGEVPYVLHNVSSKIATFL